MPSFHAHAFISSLYAHEFLGIDLPFFWVKISPCKFQTIGEIILQNSQLV
jgi:hypothetical protein